VSTAGAYNQILAFIVIVIGGLGNFSGTAKGCIFLGLVGAFIAWFAPALAVVANVAIMAIVLVVRPEGLFGKAVAKQ
jgi:branched-chain amino acid transport system permease protein